MSDQLPKRLYAKCHQCPLKDSPLVPSDPIKPDARFHIVGESPGRNEVNDGMGFVGYSGKMLWGKLQQYNVSREKCNVTNAVLCAPPSDYEEKQEILAAAAECCKPRLTHELSQTQGPIIALGKTARESVFGNTLPGEQLSTLHSRWTKIGDRWAISAYHPAFILRSPDDAPDLGYALRKAVTTEPSLIVKPTYEIVTDPNQVLDITGYVAFDIETTQISFTMDNIILLVLANGPDHAYIIPGRHPEVADVLYKTWDHPAWKEFWKPNVTRSFVAHNGKFDSRFLIHQLGWPVNVDFDTLLAHYALDERKGTHDLKGLSAKYLNVPDYEVDIKQYLRSRNDVYDKIPWNVICQYAAWDAVCTWQLKQILRQELSKQGVWPLFIGLMMPVDQEFRKMELRGMQIDTDYLVQYGEKIGDELSELTKQLSTMSNGIIWNPNSWRQVSEAFYVYKKFPRPKSRRIKPNSTSHDAVIWLEEHGVTDPIISVLKRFRKLDKMRGSYVENILNAVDDNGVVHPDMWQFGTEHGRISVRDPAAQTWPRPYEEHSKPIRDSVVAREGYRLGVADVNQAEMRVAAALSGESFLLDVYANGRDLHTEVSVEMFGPNFTKEERVQCKMFNFSYLYGGSEYSFAQDQGLSISVARAFVKKYNEVMPMLAEWKIKQFEILKQTGFIQYRTGRRRRIPLILSANEDEARKASFNAPIAGSSSDIILMALVKFGDYVRNTWDAHPLLLVHDSVIFEAPPEHIQKAGEYILNQILQTGTSIFPEVKWAGELQTGDRLGSVK